MGLFYSETEHVGMAQDQGGRDYQEDRGIYNPLHPSQLRTKTAYEIARRLFLSYSQLQAKLISIYGNTLTDGSTATTTIYNNGQFVTATLGDAMSYAVICDKQGKVRGVRRLNQIYHKPSHTSEKARIESKCGFVTIYRAFNGTEISRVNGVLAVSRAFGDNSLKPYGVTENPTVEINDLNSIAQEFGLTPNEIGNVYTVAVSDGIHDAANSQLDKAEAISESSDENYLKEIFESMDLQNANEGVVAKRLCERSKTPNCDNLTAVIKHISLERPCYLGVYDGHGGATTSSFIIANLDQMLNALLAKSTQQINALFSSESHQFFKDDLKVHCATKLAYELPCQTQPIENTDNSEAITILNSCIYQLDQIFQQAQFDTAQGHVAAQSMKMKIQNAARSYIEQLNKPEPENLSTQQIQQGLYQILNHATFYNTDANANCNAFDYLSHDMSFKQTLLDVIACIVTLGYSLYKGISNFRSKGYFDNGISLFQCKKPGNHDRFLQALNLVINDIEQPSDELYQI